MLPLGSRLRSLWRHSLARLARCVTFTASYAPCARTERIIIERIMVISGKWTHTYSCPRKYLFTHLCGQDVMFRETSLNAIHCLRCYAPWKFQRNAILNLRLNLTLIITLKLTLTPKLNLTLFTEHCRKKTLKHNDSWGANPQPMDCNVNMQIGIWPRANFRSFNLHLKQEKCKNKTYTDPKPTTNHIPNPIIDKLQNEKQSCCTWYWYLSCT